MAALLVKSAKFPIQHNTTQWNSPIILSELKTTFVHITNWSFPELSNDLWALSACFHNTKQCSPPTLIDKFFKMHLSKLKTVFVHIIKCICPIYKIIWQHFWWSRQISQNTMEPPTPDRIIFAEERSQTSFFSILEWRSTFCRPPTGWRIDIVEHGNIQRRCSCVEYANRAQSSI